MRLVIDGEERTFAGVATVAELVAQLGMKPDRVAIELNRNIIPRAAWAATPLAESDQLEIVHFVGGG